MGNRRTVRFCAYSPLKHLSLSSISSLNKENEARDDDENDERKISLKCNAEARPFLPFKQYAMVMGYFICNVN
jgi:hypothetical protein